MGYDFYEFLAVDRPLTEEQREELDQISSRSSPTDRRIAFEYNYSSLSANARELVAEYFDLGVHVSKLGRRRVLVRFPADHPTVEVANDYAVPDAVEWHDFGDFVVVDADVYRRELQGWIHSAAGWIDQISGIRKEFRDGDLRPAYLLWLAGIGHDHLPHDETIEEPPVPPGLEDRTSAQDALCRFFGFDDDHLVPAEERSREADSSSPEWESAVDELSTGEMKKYLVRFAEDDPGTRADLLTTLRETFDDDPLSDCVTTGRTAEDYRKRVEQIVEERERREAERRRLRREKRLNEVWTDRDAIWEEVDDLIETRDTSNYDAAVDRLVDLRDAAELHGELDAFRKKIRALRDEHSRLHGLRRRMDEAGLPE